MRNIYFYTILTNIFVIRYLYKYRCDTFTGKEQASLKPEDPAAEERIQQILSEAQRSMLSPVKANGVRLPLSLTNGDLKDDTGDSERRSPSTGGFPKMPKKESDDIPPEMVARIYQEELAKLLGQQVEDGFRHPMGFDRSPDDIRQALAIYHQELSRLTHLAGSAAGMPGGDAFARFAAAAASAGMANGGGFLGLPAHLIEAGLPLEARMRSDKTTASGRAGENGRGEFGNDQHSSAFSLVTPKPDERGGKRFCDSPLSANSVFPGESAAEDLSAAASPLQRMQSITNSLLTQSATPPSPSVAPRPAKAVLPPITQQQFDNYNNINTEDVVKNIKEQLSQYSISQRLFGESVLGLSQGSVSDLLARPKPWHMLTQKGREPFIRMKMFLEDDGAVHKLVASQYKIAPEKLMRTGGFVQGGTPNAVINSHQALSSVVANHLNNNMNHHQHQQQHNQHNNHRNHLNSNSNNASAKASPMIRNDPIKVQLDRQSPGFMDSGRSTGSTPDHVTNSSASALSALSAHVLSGNNHISTSSTYSIH